MLDRVRLIFEFQIGCKIPYASMPLLVWLSFAELMGEQVRPKVYGNGLEKILGL